MRKLVFFVLWLSVMSVGAQSLKKANNFIQQNDYPSAIAVLNKLIEKEPLNPAINFMLAKIYSDVKYPARDFFLAYKHINNAAAQFPKLGVLEQEKIRDYVDASQIDMFQKLIETRLFEWIKSKNSPNETNRFITECSESIYNAKARELLVSQEFQLALTSNLVEDFVGFISKYPDRRESQIAWQRIYELEYNKASLKNTTEAYKEFVLKFPESSQAKLANEKILTNDYELALKINTEETILKFIQKYPDSKQANELKKLREKTELQQLEEIQTLEVYNRFLNNYPNHESRRILMEKRDSIAYKKAVSTNTSEAFMEFITNYPNAKQVPEIIEKQKLLNFSWEELQQQRIEMFYASKLVKTMRIFKKHTNDSLQSVPFEKYVFDGNGKLLIYNLFDETGKRQEDNIYNSVNKKMEYKIIQQNEVLVDKLTFEYDTNALLLKSKSAMRQNITYYIYGTKRNCIRKITLNASGLDTIQSIEYTYQNAFIPLEKLFVTNSNVVNPLSKESYFYNKSGILLQEIQFDAVNAILAVKTYQYNSAGTLQKEIFQDKSGTETRSYIYNGYGLIEEIKVEHNSLPANNYILQYSYQFFETE